MSTRPWQRKVRAFFDPRPMMNQWAAIDWREVLNPRTVWKLRKPWAQDTTPAQRRKFYVVMTGGLGLLLAAGFAGYELGHPVYLRWKSDRAVKQARAALQNHDEGQARMALRVAMSAGLSQDGYTALAEYYESVGSPEAIATRQTIFKNAPQDLNARLAVISDALRFRDFKTARETIIGTPKEDRKDLRVQSAAAILALQTNQLPMANFILDQMKAQAPKDESIRFTRDEVLIFHPKAETAHAARLDLAEFAAAPGPHQLPALRALLRDAIAHRDSAASARWGQRLIDEPTATLGDLLNGADGLQPPGPKENPLPPPALRERIEKLARAGSAPAEAYARWLMARGHGVVAEHWLDSLENPAFAKEPRFAATRAEAAESAAEWDDLESRLKSGAWGAIPPASIELSFAAHSLEMQGNHALALRTFQAGLDQSKSSESDLQLLGHLAQAWHWPAAAIAASGAEVTAFPKDPRGYALWVGHLRATASTAEMRDALDGWRLADPSNLEARYNWALTTLLTDSAHPSPAAVDVMEKFYQSDVANPLYITGAAFARFRLGHAKEAAALLAKLKPAALKVPQRAPYAAAIFAAAGQCDECKAAQKIAPPGPAMLPEERELLRQAAAQCGS